MKLASLSTIKNEQTRYSSIPLPEFRYIPGKPFQKQAARDLWLQQMAKMAPNSLGTLSAGNLTGSPLFLYGVDLYNNKFWWEVHVVFEKLWHEFAKSSVPAEFLKGLIQIAAAFLKLEQQQYKVALQLKKTGVARVVSASRPEESFGKLDFEKRWIPLLDRFFSVDVEMTLEKRLALCSYPFMLMTDFWQPADRKSPRAYHLPRLALQPEEWLVFDDFDWSREIIVEVGCGTGEWGISEARKNPQKFYIGMERTQNRSRRLLALSGSNHPGNHLAIRADAVLLLGHRFPKNSVAEFVFFYPNPFPKKRQANLRYFVSSSFQVFHDALKKGGRILLASNVAAYVGEARWFLEESWGYRIVHDGAARFDLPRTQFERKYHLAGEDLVELEVRKSC